jgi:hypothetical protein
MFMDAAEARSTPSQPAGIAMSQWHRMQSAVRTQQCDRQFARTIVRTTEMSIDDFSHLAVHDLRRHEHRLVRVVL